MKTISKTVLQGATVALGLFLASSGVAWDKDVKFSWAGTGWDTHVDNAPAGLGINLSIADVQGPFGAKRLVVSCEFSPPGGDDTEGVVCDDGYDMLLGVLYSAHTMTFENLDLLYANADTGWMCLSTTTGHYYGEIHGDYIGGTGRFLGATGEWMTSFEGQRLEPPFLNDVGFRSIHGVSTGYIQFPMSD